MTYPTQGILHAKQVDLLVSKLIYSVEEIIKCRIDPETQAIIVELRSDNDVATIDQTMEYLIEKERDNRIIKPRTYIERKSSTLLNPHNIEGIFTRDGSIRRNLAVILFEQMDRIFVSIAQRQQAEQRKYPTMIPLNILKKCGYITSFPQNIHLVAEIPHQLAALERIRQTESMDDIVRVSPYALSLRQFAFTVMPSLPNAVYSNRSP